MPRATRRAAAASELRQLDVQNMAVIRVKDNGYGIDGGSSVPHVFEMFYQGNDPRSSPQIRPRHRACSGACRSVNMHGGTIGVTSGGVDCGSEFTLRLPVLAGRGQSPRRMRTARRRRSAVTVCSWSTTTPMRREPWRCSFEALGEPDVHVAVQRRRGATPRRTHQTGHRVPRPQDGGHGRFRGSRSGCGRSRGPTTRGWWR